MVPKSIPIIFAIIVICFNCLFFGCVSAGPGFFRLRPPVTPSNRTKVVPIGNPCQIVSPMAEKCRATSWRTAFCHPPEKRFLRGAAHSGVFAVRRLAFFAAFWSAVNRGLRPRKLMYFLTAKSTKNSPADASAYFVPANVRNGRLFAGLQANRPRFLPLLAGPSFHGSGIGPESFAAFRGGKDASGTSRKHRSLRSPLEAGFNRRIIAWSGRRTTDSPRARSGRL